MGLWTAPSQWKTKKEREKERERKGKGRAFFDFFGRVILPPKREWVGVFLRMFFFFFYHDFFSVFWGQQCSPPYRFQQKKIYREEKNVWYVRIFMLKGEYGLLFKSMESGSECVPEHCFVNSCFFFFFLKILFFLLCMITPYL